MVHSLHRGHIIPTGSWLGPKVHLMRFTGCCPHCNGWTYFTLSLLKNNGCFRILNWNSVKISVWNVCACESGVDLSEYLKCKIHFSIYLLHDCTFNYFFRGHVLDCRPLIQLTPCHFKVFACSVTAVPFRWRGIVLSPLFSKNKQWRARCTISIPSSTLADRSVCPG